MSKVYFVGCGPGDPELITIKAKKLIQKADIVVYSGSLIPKPILKFCKKGKLFNAAKLVREEIFDILNKNAKKEKYQFTVVQDWVKYPLKDPTKRMKVDWSPLVEYIKERQKFTR